MNTPIRIAITQRVEVVPERGERRDALDQAWTAFLERCGLQPVLIPNCLADPAAYAERAGIQGVVLSGGGNLSSAFTTVAGRPAEGLPAADDTAPERDRTESALLHASIKNSWPVIGVCRGMQVLNVFYGGSLSPVDGHAGVQHPLTGPDGACQPFGFDSLVNSFHRFGVLRPDLAPGLEILAEAQGVVEACRHGSYPQRGIMWHPERTIPFSENDCTLFHDFFSVKGAGT